MASARINLPLTFADSRATVFRIYRKDEGSVEVNLVAEVPIGTSSYVDGMAAFGSSYWYTARDMASGNESGASPISYIFRRASTTPQVF